MHSRFRAALCGIALLALTVALLLPGRAVVIGDFNGLDNLIKNADAIVLVGMNGYAKPPNIVIDGVKTYTGNVTMSLKGNVPVGTRLKLRLVDTAFGFREAFRDGSVHLLFLRKLPKDAEGIEYNFVGYQGGNLEMSPFGNEAVPSALPLKEQIKWLIRHYRAFREQEAKKEDALLDKVLAS